jgi:regulator of replication initiation timing
MNDILLLVATWIPVVVESGLFVWLIKFIDKKIKNHFSTPNKLVNEIKDLRASNGALNKQIAMVIEENRKLQRLNQKLLMKEKGFLNYDEEVSKN